VRALRFNLHRGDGDFDEALACRAHALAGWHAEVYVDGRELAAIEDRLRALPRVSIDHLGMHAEGLPALLRLARHGVKVKATGFGRVALDVPSVLRTIAAVAPAALVFGTDLPGTRARRAFERADLDLVAEIAPAALADNALAWYRPPAYFPA
jgi:predicted TIM-barrel fold metal-dependent hydrolase